MKQKIKLIASDLDGTLLQNHMQSCSEKAIRLIQELTKKGILFVPASGRQYFNLYNMFKEVQGDLMYLCENGSLVMYHDEVFWKHQFERELALEISHMVMEDPQSEVLMSGERTCYIVPKNIDYVSHLRNDIKNDVTVISKPEDITEPIIKVSYFTPEDHQEEITEMFKKKIAGRCQLMVSGTEWADFTPLGVNKGAVMKAISEKLGITPEEMVAFGDNENDRSMLEFVGQPYLMKNCNPTMEDVKAARCERVEDILEEILDKMS